MTHLSWDWFLTNLAFNMHYNGALCYKIQLGFMDHGSDDNLDKQKGSFLELPGFPWSWELTCACGLGTWWAGSEYCLLKPVKHQFRISIYYHKKNTQYCWQTIVIVKFGIFIYAHFWAALHLKNNSNCPMVASTWLITHLLRGWNLDVMMWLWKKQPWWKSATVGV